ncbi:MAG: hypothetical protein M3295_08565 [Chloroflexota bacterium]|nr:hypothetical protein [Chloroflexota bacterium]
MLRLGGRTLTAACAAAIAAGASPAPVLGHGFERPFALPVPLGLYLTGAAAAVALSFVVSAVAGRPGGSVPRYSMTPVAGRVARAAVVLPFIGLAWWVTMIVSGVTGTVHDFVPAVLFWVLLWVGVPITSVLVGNPWPALSPFRAIVSGAERLLRPFGVRAIAGVFAYPDAFARWPAVALLLAGLAFELVVPGSFAGGVIGWMLLVYTAVTLVGIVLFGATGWLRNAELFDVLFGWFGRIGPIGRRSISGDLCDGCPEGCSVEHCIDCPDCTAARAAGEQEAVKRPWFAGLTEVRAAGWSDAAFILLALAGVTYDGLRETVAWGAVVSALFEPVQHAIGVLNTIIALDAIGLVGTWLLFLAAFALAAAATRALSSSGPSLSAVAGAYAATLLPIAGGYLVAHYFTLLVQGVVWLPLLFVDPRSVAPDISWIPSQAIWYVSVVGIVLGHVAAVVLAHRLALRHGRRRAFLVGAPLVLLMLGYTVLSLWIIAQPLTVEPVT